MADSILMLNPSLLSGVWLPAVTPFLRGAIDESSFAGLLDHVVSSGVSGIVVAGTTGESSVLADEELLLLARAAKERLSGRLPLLVGAGGADTRRTISLVAELERIGVDGVLSVVPFYNRPDQRGILAHFEAVAASTRLPIVLYNIPYRTGVTMRNETVRRLAAIDNIVGLKDSSGDLRQSAELLLDPPEDFSILTGEDAFFYPMLALGARGGILASAHWRTDSFVSVWRAVEGGDFSQARAAWKRLFPVIPLFFEEPNPAPIKYWLESAGLIASAEVRLPLVGPSDGLKERLRSIDPARFRGSAAESRLPPNRRTHRH